jgi:hypothetical protein
VSNCLIFSSGMNAVIRTEGKTPLPKSCFQDLLAADMPAPDGQMETSYFLLFTFVQQVLSKS